GSGNWNVGGNWTAGVPVAGSDANIIENDAINRVVTYDYTGVAVTLSALTLDNAGSGLNTLSQSANVLNSASETVGSTGRAVYNQSGGTNTLTNTLILGANAGSSGTYTLSGSGSLTANFEHIGQLGTG